MKDLTGKSLIINVCEERGLAEGIDAAKGVILAGGVVAFPTESFYGLAVNPMDEQAVEGLFRVKKRESDLPILILISSLESLNTYVKEIPDIARALMDKFWPGGLTILFEPKAYISQRLTAGTGKLGVRLSSHPVATALAGSVNSPITGTSANISGRPPCRTAMEVYNYFQKGILILDGGNTEGGRGSTIVDVTVRPPKIVRDGMIGAEELGLL